MYKISRCMTIVNYVYDLLDPISVAHFFEIVENVDVVKSVVVQSTFFLSCSFESPRLIHRMYYR